MSGICRFIHVEKAHYPVTLLCAVLQIARSSYCAWDAGNEMREAGRREDEALTHEITVIHLASQGTYGAPGCTRLCVEEPTV